MGVDFEASCDERYSLHGRVCDNGVCEFGCSYYAGYTCQNNSVFFSSLSMCGYVLLRDSEGQNRAPSEEIIMHQLEVGVVN